MLRNTWIDISDIRLTSIAYLWLNLRIHWRQPISEVWQQTRYKLLQWTLEIFDSEYSRMEVPLRHMSRCTPPEAPQAPQSFRIDAPEKLSTRSCGVTSHILFKTGSKNVKSSSSAEGARKNACKSCRRYHHLPYWSVYSLSGAAISFWHLVAEFTALGFPRRRVGGAEWPHQRLHCLHRPRRSLMCPLLTGRRQVFKSCQTACIACFNVM